MTLFHQKLAGRRKIPDGKVAGCAPTHGRSEYVPMRAAIAPARLKSNAKARTGTGRANLSCRRRDQARDTLGCGRVLVQGAGLAEMIKGRSL